MHIERCELEGYSISLASGLSCPVRAPGLQFYESAAVRLADRVCLRQNSTKLSSELLNYPEPFSIRSTKPPTLGETPKALSL